MEAASNAAGKTGLLHLLSDTAKKLKFSRILTASQAVVGHTSAAWLAAGFSSKIVWAGKFW
jgi:hypothetical protein